MNKEDFLAQKLWQVHAHCYPNEPEDDPNWQSLDENEPDEDTVSRSLFRQWAREILHELSKDDENESDWPRFQGVEDVR